MAMWPFRKRRKTKDAEGKNPVVPNPPTVERKLSLIRKASLRQNPRRSTSRRMAAAKDREPYASSRAPVPDFPVPPDCSSSPTPMDTEFQPPKQPHGGGFSSYFVEMNRPATNSSASSHRPHKSSSIIRKFSKKGRGTKQEQPPPSAYIQQLARTASKRGGKRMRRFDSFEYDRPMSQSSLPARESLGSSLSSISSIRAYRIRSFELFTPRPRLRIDDGSKSPQDPTRLDMAPSRSNSRTSPEWRRQNSGREVPHHGGMGSRIDDLADELDSKGLREAMDRDKKRREKKKLEEQERLQRKLEKRAMKEREQVQPDGDIDMDADQDTDRNLRRFVTPPAVNMGESSRAAAAYGLSPLHPYPFIEVDDHDHSASMGTQTPLSWLNDPSTEDISKGGRYSPRTDMVTPVSMDSVDDTRERPGLYTAEEVHVTPHSHTPISPIHSRNNSKSKKLPGVQVDSPTAQHGGFAFGRPMEVEEVEDEQGSTRGKKSAWTSFIKRATAARIQKEQASREIQAGESTLVSDSEEEGFDNAREHVRQDHYNDVEGLRRHQGQTPGRHIPAELAFAMTALETGRTRGKDEIEDEQRDHFSPAPPPASYPHYGRPSSSRSSLGPIPHRPQANLRGLHTNAPISQTQESREHSPTSPAQIPRTSSQQSHHIRPTSVQRYSPSMHRYSSGQASPDGGPRSAMSTSLASIDSEGSWLSGKMANPRHSVAQISPLRTSATSLRRRYKEFDDGASAEGDDYFSGVETRRHRSIGEEINGETRMDLSAVEDSEEEDDDGASIDSETEQKMWRDGFGKKVVIQEVSASPRVGVLKDSENFKPAGEGLGRSTSIKKEFMTPLEHPAARQSTVAEIVRIPR